MVFVATELYLAPTLPNIVGMGERNECVVTKTKDFVAQLNAIPNTALYSPLWSQIMAERLRGAATKTRHGEASNGAPQQGGDAAATSRKN